MYEFKQLLIMSILYIVCSANTICDYEIQLSQEVLNDGFHKNFTYQILFKGDSSADLDNCEIVVEQFLPDGIFYNPDELEDLNRNMKLSAFASSRVDVERAAEGDKGGVVLLRGAVREACARIWLPLHLRYHRPQLDRQYISIWVEHARVWARCVGHAVPCALSSRRLPLPCAQDCQWHRLPLPSAGQLEVKVPVGALAAGTWVAAVTAAAVAVAGLIVTHTLLTAAKTSR